MMCVIAICDKRKLTGPETKAMWNANDHGAGAAWAIKGGVEFRKGFMTYAEFAKFYFCTKLPLPHIVHFRISTAGGVVPELTHPFVVSKDASSGLSYSGKNPVLFQNGCLRDWAVYVTTIAAATDNPIKGAMSDSRLLAMIKYYVPSIIPDIAPGKLAILDNKGRIETVGAFEKSNGIRVSNMHWKARAAAAKSAQSHNMTNLNPDKPSLSLLNEWDPLRGVVFGD